MVYLGDFAITSLETITCFDVTTGEYLFTLDELQNANLSQSEDVVDITGKQGRKITRIKRNKAVTVSADNGMVSAGLWAAQTGSDFEESNTAIVEWNESLRVVTGNKATTSYIAVGTAGAEISNLFVKNSDGTLGAKLTQATDAAPGKFAYNPASKEISFYTDVTVGSEIMVFYKRRIQAAVLQNSSDTYSKKVKMYIDAIGEDKCANVKHVQIEIQKADFSGEFSFDMGDNQTIHSFEAEALAGGCGEGNNFFTWTVFSQDAADRDANGDEVSD